MASLGLTAPAKINLFLEILGRRADGYHEIQTLLQMVNLTDEVTLTRHARGIDLEATGWPTPSGDANLAAQAARAFFAETGLRGGVRIELCKGIPPGSGLGGGSSDVAAVLVGLNRLYGEPLGPAALVAIGARIGSDVPFFLGGPTAWATGRGERITPLPVLPPMWFCVVVPAFTVATAWAYGALKMELTGGGKAITLSELLAGNTINAMQALLTSGYNRLEKAVFPRYPVLERLKGQLRDWGALPAMLTGTGSAVIGRAETREMGLGWAEKLRAEGHTVFVVETLTVNLLGGVM
ncbi:MAG: 4-(cytidine 5'-diphospho)-2-C-methyl-D-erythritol kinase [Candidatus Methylomirabilales bacterium]